MYIYIYIYIYTWPFRSLRAPADPGRGPALERSSRARPAPIRRCFLFCLLLLSLLLLLVVVVVVSFLTAIIGTLRCPLFRLVHAYLAYVSCPYPRDASGMTHEGLSIILIIVMLFCVVISEYCLNHDYW